MNKKVPDITESVEDLKSLLRTATEKHQTQRLSVLYLLRSGQAKNRTQVAELLGVHRISVGQWLEIYETQGLEKLLERRYAPGRVPALTEAQRAELRAALEKPEGFHSYVQIQAYIADTFGVEMKYKAVYALVREKWGANLKVPRKSHEKKKPEAVEAFVSTFQEQVADAILEKSSDLQTVRLFCQDESRYGLLSVIRRRITLPGIKPIAKVNDRYESVYLYGAVEPRTGRHFFLELSHLTADCFQIFLNQFSEAFRESLNLLVLDNGRFHHAKSLEIPENVILLFLPPYSPELNPVERLWQDIKAKVFTHTYETLEAMQTKVTEILREFSNAAIAKLTGFSYFINAANAI